MPPSVLGRGLPVLPPNFAKGCYPYALCSQKAAAHLYGCAPVGIYLAKAFLAAAPRLLPKNIGGYFHQAYPSLHQEVLRTSSYHSILFGYYNYNSIGGFVKCGFKKFTITADARF